MVNIFEIAWSWLGAFLGEEQLPGEARATRENAAIFLSELRTDYDIQSTDMNNMEPEISKNLRFVAPRISRMINEFLSA